VSGLTVATPPNGSGAGKTAVLGSGAAGNSCNDIGRSSSGPGGSELATTEYWAYALDAVDWVRFTGNATPSLTKAQLQSIYNCDSVTKKPSVTDWSGITGSGVTGPIKRYIAQTGSGTGNFFATYLNGSSTNLNTNCADGTTVQATPGDTTDYRAIVTQENDARAIPTAEKARSIYYMSYGQWYAQSKSVLADLRNGAVLGAIDVAGVLKKPSTATLNTTSTRFPATRYLYNILDTRNPDHTAAAEFVGAGDFDANPATPVTNGWLCSGLGSNSIKLLGFAPLKKAVDPATTISSYCLKNPTPLSL
jgi:ABC-type phosphate transport system substrate-binding protein